MRQSIRSLVSRCCSAIAFVGGLAAGTVLRGETIDFSGYFEERRTLDTAAALLNTFTLEEAKRSAGVLDGHLAKDPGNTVVAGLKSVLQTVYRADQGLTAAGETARRNETAAKRLEALARDSLTPSALTGKVDEITATRYRREAADLSAAAETELTAARRTLHSALRDALDYSAFCRDRGEGRVAAKLQQLARSKARQLSPDRKPADATLEFWSEKEIAAALAAGDRLENALRRGADALLGKRYLEISRITAADLASFPGNPWLLALDRAAREALAEAAAQFDACGAAREARDYETALALAEKCLALVSDHEGAAAAKRELATLLARREERLAEAKVLEEAGQYEEAWMIYDLYGRNEDLLRVAGPAARECEERGDFSAANALYKIARDAEGVRRTSERMRNEGGK